MNTDGHTECERDDDGIDTYGHEISLQSGHSIGWHSLLVHYKTRGANLILLVRSGGVGAWCNYGTPATKIMSPRPSAGVLAPTSGHESHHWYRDRTDK